MMQCVANGHEIVALANLKPPTGSGKGNVRRRRKKKKKKEKVVYAD